MSPWSLTQISGYHTTVTCVIVSISESVSFTQSHSYNKFGIFINVWFKIPDQSGSSWNFRKYLIVLSCSGNLYGLSVK